MTTLARPSLLSRMASLFAAQARVYCLSTLIAGALGIAALTVVSMLMVRGGAEVGWDPVAIWRSMTFSHQLLAVFGMLCALWTPILLAARGVCRITTSQLAGQSISLRDVLVDMARFIPAAFVYALIIGVPTLIGSSILFIPGIAIASLFVLVVPTSTNESLGIFATLRRGVSLGGRVFGKELLLTLAAGASVGLLLVLRIVFLDRFIPGTYSSLFALRFALTYIPSLLVLILANISFTLEYHEARAVETVPVPGGSTPYQP
jgi:hypothetical protein